MPPSPGPEAGSGKYVVEKQIGKGAFGVAHIAKSKVDGKRCVVKKVRLAKLSNLERQASLTELLLLSNLSHRNILAYLDAWVESGCISCLAVELCECGDLMTQLKARVGQQQHFNEVHLHDMLVQLASCLAYMHRNNITHRDIKSSNVFITGNGCLKLADFGLAAILDPEDPVSRTMVGTPNYMSPEILKEEPYGIKNDIWALGCVMFELTALKPAFQAFNMEGLAKKITSGPTPHMPPQYSEEWKEVIKAMLSKDEDDRPSAEDILQLPWLQPAIKRVEERYGPALPAGASPRIKMQDLPAPIAKLAAQFKQAERDAELRKVENRAHMAEMQARWAPNALKARWEEERRKAEAEVAAVKAKQGVKDGDTAAGERLGTEASGVAGQVGAPSSGPRIIRTAQPPVPHGENTAGVGPQHHNVPGSARGHMPERRASGTPILEAGRLGAGENVFRVKRASSENRAAELHANPAASDAPRRVVASRLSHGHGWDQNADRGQDEHTTATRGTMAAPTVRQASPGGDRTAGGAYAAQQGGLRKDGGKGGHSLRDSLKQMEERKVVSCPSLRPLDQIQAPVHPPVSGLSHGPPSTVTAPPSASPHSALVRHSLDVTAVSTGTSPPPHPPSGKPPPHPMRASMSSVPHKPPVHPSTREAWGSASPVAAPGTAGGVSPDCPYSRSPTQATLRASVTMPAHHTGEQQQQPPTLGAARPTSRGLRALLAATTPAPPVAPSGRQNLGRGPSPGKGSGVPVKGRRSEADAMHLPAGTHMRMGLSPKEQAELAVLYGKERRVTLTG